MAINRNFNGASIFKPGAYSRTKVNLAGGFPLAASGIVAIVGEATGGEPGSSAGVLTFTSEQVAAVQEIYKSGPIVDAVKVLVSPARDARVVNGASLIRVYKTNASTKAYLAVENAASTTLFNIASANWGEDENLISVTIAAGSSANSRIVIVNKGTQKEILSENVDETKLIIQYVGTEAAANLTIQNGILAVSAGGDSINIVLANKSIQDLVDIINANANYTASTSIKLATTKQASDLDPISTDADIKSAPVELKAAQKELIDIINAESSLITVSRVADVEGQVKAINKSFLSGGTLGASSNTDFQNGFDAHLALRSNIVIPLVSQDASDLALLDKTDPASSFTIDAVNLQAVTHCITASNTKNRSERNCYISVKKSFSDSQDAALDINSERASMLFLDVEVLGADGNLKWLDPWAASCIVGGIQAGTPSGTPATFKQINVNGIRHQDYNPKTQVALAIKNGLLPFEEIDSGGFRVVVHNSTYSSDANFVYNRPSVLEAADTVAYNLRAQLESIFVGTKAKTGSATAIKNTVIAIMTTFLNDEIIVGDDTNENLGWKDLVVTINGNTAFVDITITPVQGIDFILNTITLDNIRQTAE